MSEQFANNCSTTVAAGGYTAGSGVLNVASTASPWPAAANFRVSIFDQTTNALKVILNVTAINSGTQWAVTAEGADASANAGDNVLGTMLTAAVMGEFVRATLVTTVGSPGTNTNVPTEEAVRTAIGAGGGNVSGPASAVSGDIVQFDGTTGKLIKDGLGLVTTVGTPGSDANVASEKAVRTAIAGGGGAGNAGHVSILPLSYSSVGQGTWELATNGNDIVNGVLQNNTHANGDNVSFLVDLPAGTYTFLFVYEFNTDHGKIDVSIGGTVVTTVDQYGSHTYNNRSLATGLVLAGGITTITLTLNGKNSSSSDYYCTVQYLALWRTP